MRIWIFSHMRASPSISLLRDAAAARGHESRHVHPEEFDVVLASPRGADILVDKKKVPDAPDAVLTRLGSSAPSDSLLVVRQLELLGIACYNRAAALERSRSKVRTFQRLVTEGLPLPPTVLLSTGRYSSLERALREIDGPPWIVKLPHSFKGIGVVKVDSLGSLTSLVDTLKSLNTGILLQKFIGEAAGRDLRVIVLNGRAIAAMERASRPGDFRANLHQGGTAEARALTPEIADIAQRATVSLGLHLAGVDLMETVSGPVIIEVNGSPGLEGIQNATKIDIAERIIQWVEGTRE